MGSEEDILKAIEHLTSSITEKEVRGAIPFNKFISVLYKNPEKVIRNIFQLFYDMMKFYINKGVDEYQNDPESINYANYDCSKLFVEGSDHPFFADRLFANRLVKMVDAFKIGAQQNKIYIFKGPHGSGKSTFLNNLLARFEIFANSDEGLRYETLWRIDKSLLENNFQSDNLLLEKVYKLFGKHEDNGEGLKDKDPDIDQCHNCIDVPCPNHDNPLLIIPKKYRRSFFDNLFLNNEFKWKLFVEKEYEWIFNDTPCTICSSIFEALLNKVKNPYHVFDMVYARPYRFNRRLGEGISVFNPGDNIMKENVLKNPLIQRQINDLLKDSNIVNYIFSRFSKINNGIYALMDIKSHNTNRLIKLHNIVSEKLHKVEDIEENVNALFIGIMNPEDENEIQNIQSFSDRIEYIKIPYVLDLNTEVNIYKNIFGKHILAGFLPRVLHNFARAVISTRLNNKSKAMNEWIKDPKKYNLYCDENLQLLKMEIFTGHIPPWVDEEDIKNFTAKRRKKIIAESENEGVQGFSGRDSIKMFNDFYSIYANKNKLIDMNCVYDYFTKKRKDLKDSIPFGFLDSLIKLYDYTVLQEIKESIFYYNEEQISKDIQNYIFAVNFEIGLTQVCTYTGDKIEITNDFLESIENRLFGKKTNKEERVIFRNQTQKEYASKTLTQEIIVNEKNITQTELYSSLHDKYVHNIKEKVLDPFLGNENFRLAIKDFDKEAFKTYDKKIRNDVTFLINNLCERCGYIKEGAKGVCIYTIDNNIAKKFS